MNLLTFTSSKFAPKTPISPPIKTRQNVITFSTAWYDLGAKFKKEQFFVWAKYLLENVRKFNLVVYVEDEETAHFIKHKLANNNPNVYVIIFPFRNLPLYKKYANEFQRNHQYNTQINWFSSWSLVLLWCSKQFFVQTTEEQIIQHNPEYPNVTTEYYGWTDIGYFRSRDGKIGELSPIEIQEFPNYDKLRNLIEKDKIHYAIVDPEMIDKLKPYVYNRDVQYGVPKIPIPVNQISVAGGFFILSGGNNVAKIWREQFELHIDKYFKGGCVIKDDQYILIDIMILNPMVFKLWSEPKLNNRDSWFLFQRLLC